MVRFIKAQYESVLVLEVVKLLFTPLLSVTLQSRPDQRPHWYLWLERADLTKVPLLSVTLQSQVTRMPLLSVTLQSQVTRMPLLFSCEGWADQRLHCYLWLCRAELTKTPLLSVTLQSQVTKTSLLPVTLQSWVDQDAIVICDFPELSWPRLHCHLSCCRAELTKIAEKASVDVFASNLKNLLMTPPVRGKVVLGVDPGFRTGCKFAVTSVTCKCVSRSIRESSEHLVPENLAWLCSRVHSIRERIPR